MLKPLDVVICGHAVVARDLFMDARDLARAQRAAIGWSAHRFALEYADHEVEWLPVSAVTREIRGRRIRHVHIAAGTPDDLLTENVVGVLLAAQLPADGRADWTFGDAQTEQLIKGRRGDDPAAAAQGQRR